MRYSVYLCVLALSCNSGKDSGRTPSGGDRLAQGGDADPGDPAAACVPGQIRDGHGNCVTVCTENSDCDQPEEVCNIPLGLCVPAPPSSECDPINCGPGLECPPEGGGVDCVPIEGWCGGDQDCAFGERCDSETNQCVSRVGEVIMTCESDLDCWDQGGLVLTCQGGVCVGCVDDLQCGVGAGNRCVLGACVIVDLGPAGECLDADCADGYRCSLVTGQCEFICATDEDCGAGESCLPIANRCVPEYGCEDAGDCMLPDMQCIAGLCVGCASDDDCRASETCIATACFPRIDATACDGVTCDVGDVCDPATGDCYPENGTCVDESDCRSGQTCNFLRLCSGCSVDSDCRPGQRCLLSTCLQI